MADNHGSRVRWAFLLLGVIAILAIAVAVAFFVGSRRVPAGPPGYLSDAQVTSIALYFAHFIKYLVSP
jgi:hypothetical protein